VNKDSHKVTFLHAGLRTTKNTRLYAR